MNRHMWQRLLYSVAGLVVITGVTYSCKNFLDQPAQGTVDQATLMNKVGVEGSLVAAYRALDCSSSSGAWGCAVSNWVWGGVTSNDAYKGSDLGDQNPIHSVEIFQWNLGDADSYLNQKWSQVYEGVFRANAAIRILDAVVAASPNEISVPDQNAIRGEALFLRAHYHFEAYRMWGHIPYYFEADSLPVAVGGYRKANDLPLDSIVKLIIADLSTAETLLPNAPRNGEKGRASRYTAMAYKGRVQVYGAGSAPASPYWAAAKATFDSVKASGVYGLETGYNRVWTADPAFRNGKETIFAYQASVRDGEPNGQNANFGERLNFPYSEANHFTCCGFYQPSFNLVNFYLVDAAGLPLAMSSATWNSPTPEPAPQIPPSDTGQVWKGLNFHGGIMTPVDPRLDWTVGRDRVPYKDWNLHARSWIRDASYSGPYSPKKNVHEQAFPDAEDNVGWVATQTNNVPIHIFRYADMLLMDAEVEVELGNLDVARAIVNQIRARAAVVAQGCGADATVLAAYTAYCTGKTSMTDTLQANVATGVDSLQSGWAFYKIGLYNTPWTGLGQAYARNAVRAERRLELAMEGQRFFDLRRWAIADTSVNNYVSSEAARISYLAGAAGQFTLPKYQFYPIPSVQVELSKVGGQCRLQQNTGWGACQ